MINPSKYIRKAYLQLLSGLTSGSVPVPVFDRRIPISTPTPSTRVIITSQTNSITRENKCGHSWECTIILDVITEQDISFVNSAIVDDIEEQISNAIDTWTNTGQDISIPPFTVYHTTFQSSTDFELEFDTTTIIRRVIRYVHILNGI